MAAQAEKFAGQIEACSRAGQNNSKVEAIVIGVAVGKDAFP